MRAKGFRIAHSEWQRGSEQIFGGSTAYLVTLVRPILGYFQHLHRLNRSGRNSHPRCLSELILKLLPTLSIPLICDHYGRRDGISLIKLSPEPLNQLEALIIIDVAQLSEWRRESRSWKNNGKGIEHGGLDFCTFFQWNSRDHKFPCLSDHEFKVAGRYLSGCGRHGPP